jgi:8-oxo-dGTP pyrophosphatase MutT (NUDIX family)
VVEFFFVKHGKNGRWTFPKGHQELGETLMETAIREIREEAGLSGLTYVDSLGKTSFRYRRENVTVEKTVHFFLFEAPANAKEILTGEEAIWEAIWVPATEVYKTCGYRNLCRLLAAALKRLGVGESA